MAKKEIYLTDIERVLCAAIENEGFRLGIDFAVQYPIKNSFILDFAFPKQKVAIETDGKAWHSSPEAKKRDGFKTHTLKRLGWALLRFSDNDIQKRLKECILSIHGAVRQGTARSGEVWFGEVRSG